MKLQLPAHLQRVAAVALPVMLIMSLGAALIRPFVLMYQDRDAEILLMQKRLGEYRIAADSRTALEQQIEQLRNDPRIASRHLKNTVPALAGAELQQHIQKLAGRHGARLVSMQAVENDAQAELHAVTVRIRLQADTKALQNLLYSLESDRPLITLDNMYVRTLGSVRGSDGTKESLDIGFDATGYALVWST